MKNEKYHLKSVTFAVEQQDGIDVECGTRGSWII